MEFKYRFLQNIGSQIELEIIDPSTNEVVNTFVTSEVDLPTGTFKGKPIENFKAQEEPKKSKFIYEIKKRGPERSVIVFEVKEGKETQIYQGSPSFSATEQVLIEEAIIALENEYPGVKDMAPRNPPPPSDLKYVYEEVRQGPRIGIKVYKVEKGVENLIYTGELASGSTTTYDQLRQEAINALQANNPGVDKMTSKSGAAAAGSKFSYEIKSFGPQKFIVVYQSENGQNTQIYEGEKLIGSTPENQKQTAILALQDKYPGIADMVPKAPPTASSGPTYVYEIRDLGFEKAVVVYERNQGGEKQIHEGPPSLTATEEVLIQEAKVALKDRFPGVENMTEKNPALTPKPKTPPPPTPTDPPVPQKDTELPYYIPKSRISEPQSTSGNEFVIKDTGEPYTGFYIETYKGTFFAGKTPEENGVEIVLAEENPGLERKFQELLPLLQNLAIAFIPTLSGLQKLLGKATRHFVQDKKTGKITETDEETAQQISEQIPGNLPNYRVASVEWVTKGPAEDKVINGYLYEGAESKNKKAIEALEKQMPGISSIVTNYADLVEDPVGRKNTAVDTKKVEEKPLTDQLGNLRKANFDTRI